MNLKSVLLSIATISALQAIPTGEQRESTHYEKVPSTKVMEPEFHSMSSVDARFRQIYSNNLDHPTNLMKILEERLPQESRRLIINKKLAEAFQAPNKVVHVQELIKSKDQKLSLAVLESLFTETNYADHFSESELERFELLAKDNGKKELEGFLKEYTEKFHLSEIRQDVNAENFQKVLNGDVTFLENFISTLFEVNSEKSKALLLAVSKDPAFSQFLTEAQKKEVAKYKPSIFQRIYKSATGLFESKKVSPEVELTSGPFDINNPTHQIIYFLETIDPKSRAFLESPEFQQLTFKEQTHIVVDLIEELPDSEVKQRLIEASNQASTVSKTNKVVDYDVAPQSTFNSWSQRVTDAFKSLKDSVAKKTEGSSSLKEKLKTQVDATKERAKSAMESIKKNLKSDMAKGIVVGTVSTALLIALITAILGNSGNSNDQNTESLNMGNVNTGYQNGN